MRSFLMAFLARGNLDLFALISKVKTQQAELSSYSESAMYTEYVLQSHLLGCIM